jgi:putative transposase
VLVTPASVTDREGAKALLAGIKNEHPRLSHFWFDQGYAGEPFAAWIRENLACTLEIPRHPASKNWRQEGEPAATPTPFRILPRRWAVERTFGWTGRNRRLSKDYEGLPETEEALFYLATGRLMARRLAFE